MRRLLSINAYHYIRGGADVMYFDHAALFESNGWTNSFSSMHHAENLPCVDSEFFADEIDYHKSGTAISKLVDAGRIIYSGEARRKIAALLDTRVIDMAHVHNIYHHQSPSVLIELKRRNIPVVITAHDLKLACPNNRMMNRTGVCERCKGGRVWNALRYRCVQSSTAASGLIMIESAIHKALSLYDRHLDRIVTPSAFYRSKLIEWGWDGRKIVHIPNFISAIPPKQAPVLGNYLLYFGRLAPEKGLATLVRAAAQARVSVHIVGAGPEEHALRTLATELAAPVTFVGFRSGTDLWAAVDGARAVVLPSEWYENGPMSIIEAFARGKPLIGADIGGIPELVDGETTGWSFRSADVADLARALDAAMTADIMTLSAKSDAAYAKVQAEFSPSAYFRKMNALYTEILS
jgi:glycosyltransferase involved in cell wall biosynthesis